MAVLGALGDLVLSLSADTARFQSDLGRADRVAKKFGREVGQALGNLAGMLVALGGAAGFGALVRNQIDAADAAGKMAQKIGISVEELSAYMVQAKLADVSTEQLQTGFQQLAKNQADFIAGTGEAADAFRALGIEAKDLNALNGDTGAIFELVAGKLAKLEDGANKTAIAMKIFGRSGTELIPLINELEKTRKEAAMLNAIIDDDTAAAAERFNDNLTRVGIAVQAVGLNVARVVLPTLEKFSARMVQAAKDTEGMEKAAKVADSGLKILASAGTIVLTIFKTVGETLGGFAAMMVQLLTGRWTEAIATSKNIMIDWQSNVTAAVEALKDTWTSVPQAVTDAADNVYDNRQDTADKLAAPSLVSAEMVKKAEKEKHDAIMRVYHDAMGAAEADAEITKKATEDKEKMWQQVFDTIDQEQEDAIEEGRIFLQHLEDGDRFAERFGDSVAGAFKDVAFNIGDATDAVRAFGQQLASIIFDEAVGSPLATAVRGAIRGGFAGAGGSAAGAGLAEEAAALGIQGLAEGTPFVERDGLAFLHKGEAVIPADQNRAGGGITINQGAINIGAGNAVTKSEVEAALRQSERRTVAVVQELRRR